MLSPQSWDLIRGVIINHGESDAEMSAKPHSSMFRLPIHLVRGPFVLTGVVDDE